jgi:hypothetical protein
MKLTDLAPEIAGSGFLVFDCPNCRGDASHRIRVPLSPAVGSNGCSWQHTGDTVETLTLTPSVDAGCWHGNITDGRLVGGLN